MRIGDIDLTLLSDGTTWWDGGGAFGLVPKCVGKKLLPPDEQNRIPMVLRCLLVRTPQATVLVDAGMGDKVTPEMAEQQNFRLERPNGWLVDDLARHGVFPEDVDLVVLSHLHDDHCGGSTRILDGQLGPTFRGLNTGCSSANGMTRTTPMSGRGPRIARPTWIRFWHPASCDW